MKNKIKFIFILEIILLVLCGCDKNNDSTKEVNNNNELKELKEMIETNNTLIKELTTKNEELESKIKTLEEEKNTLNETMSTLKSENSSLKNSLDSKYNELKTIINNTKNTTISNKYTITKKELLGTWTYSTNSSITFTDENLNVYDNWFTWKDMAFYYMYKDGNLYITDDGIIMKKK